MSLALSVASGDVLEVRRFTVHEAVSEIFLVDLVVRGDSPSVDLEAIVGKPATFHVVSALTIAGFEGRTWKGIVRSIEQVQAVSGGAGKEMSTYALRIVPDLWLLTQRRGYRVHQHVSIPDITDKLLKEWSITPKWKIDRDRHPKLEYKVQYGESDYSFLCRLWEEAGIAFTFADEGKGTELVLCDKLEAAEPRAADPIHFVDNPNPESEQEFVTNVRLQYVVRPGATTIRDYDHRNPTFALFGEAPKAAAPEDKYEQYHYEPHGFLVEGAKGGQTPVADDKGVARHEQGYGLTRAERWLGGDRMGRRMLELETNVMDLWPGVAFFIDHHPHTEISEATKLVMTTFSLEGSSEGEWTMSGTAVFTDVPYEPPRRTQKPRAEGVQSAVVVGPKGQEIHTDEFGRVRVQFPWDREGKNDDGSSCWIRVSQGWAGTGYGMIVIPRIGQEVLVGFLGGDPEAPIVVGRVFNANERVPYPLPEHKTRSTWKSDSSLGHGGFNEIMFEDLKGQELVWEQAEKNRRRLVKNDETITVGHDRQKLVQHDEYEKTLGFVKIFIGQDQDIVVKHDKRERVEGDSHIRVWGKRNQQIDGSMSLTVGKDRHEVVGKNHAMAAVEEIHFAAGTALVIEAANDLTLKGPGGFIRIDSAGVTIRGNVVKINSGGSAGSGKGASPEAPDQAIEAVTDDVSKTLIGQ